MMLEAVLVNLFIILFLIFVYKHGIGNFGSNNLLFRSHILHEIIFAGIFAGYLIYKTVVTLPYIGVRITFIAIFSIIMFFSYRSAQKKSFNTLLQGNKMYFNKNTFPWTYMLPCALILAVYNIVVFDLIPLHPALTHLSPLPLMSSVMLGLFLANLIYYNMVRDYERSHLNCDILIAFAYSAEIRKMLIGKMSPRQPLRIILKNLLTKNWGKIAIVFLLFTVMVTCMNHEQSVKPGLHNINLNANPTSEQVYKYIDDVLFYTKYWNPATTKDKAVNKLEQVGKENIHLLIDRLILEVDSPEDSTVNLYLTEAITQLADKSTERAIRSALKQYPMLENVIKSKKWKAKLENID